MLAGHAGPARHLLPGASSAPVSGSLPSTATSGSCPRQSDLPAGHGRERRLSGRRLGQPHTRVRTVVEQGRRPQTAVRQREHHQELARSARTRGPGRRVTASCRSCRSTCSGPPLGWGSCFQPSAPRSLAWPCLGLCLRWTQQRAQTRVRRRRTPERERTAPAGTEAASADTGRTAGGWDPGTRLQEPA